MAYSIDPCPNDIQETMKRQPRQSDPVTHLREAVELDTVDDGNGGRDAHCNEYGRAVRAPGWGAEAGV